MTDQKRASSQYAWEYAEKSSDKKSLKELSAREQEELHQLLQRAGFPLSAITTLTMLDGFLTCLVIGPQKIPAKEWQSTLCGARHPDLSEPDFHQLTTLIDRHHQHIRQGFEKSKPTFRLLFKDYTRAKNAKPVARQLNTIYEWCTGFMRATEICPTRWELLLNQEDSHSILYMIWLLGTIEGCEQMRSQAMQCYMDDGYDELEARHMMIRWLGLRGTQLKNIADLKKSLIHIHDYWKQGSLCEMRDGFPTISYEYRLKPARKQTNKSALNETALYLYKSNAFRNPSDPNSRVKKFSVSRLLYIIKNWFR